MSDPFPTRREFARMHEMHYDEDRHRGDSMDEIPFDPFHSLVMRGWAVDISPVGLAYTEALGTHSLTIRRYDDSRHKVLRSFQLFGNEPERLLERAADVARRYDQGAEVPTGSYFGQEDRWI